MKNENETVKGMEMYLKLVIFEYEPKQIIGKYKNVVKSGDKKQVNTKFLLRPKKRKA